MIRLNREITRAIDDSPAFGVACYEGSVKDGRFVGVHCGCCKDLVDAERWLAGQAPKSMIRIYETGAEG